jgi:hypothetical protein
VIYTTNAIESVNARLRKIINADSSEGGHLFQPDRGHHSNLMAASLLSSRGPVSVMS